MIWGAVGLVLILSVGIYLSVRSGFVQIRFFPRALKTFLNQFKNRKSTTGVSGYQALCTALAATVGTGNLAGVAGAICLGGPGAVFWMWICGILGMGIKFAEATLAVCYRVKNANGEYSGGPMFMIRQGMGKRWDWLAILYCFFGVVAAFGVGNATQINAVFDAAAAAAEQFGVTLGIPIKITLALVLAVLVIVLLRGGARRVGAAAQKLVPLAAVGYLLLGAAVLIIHFDRIPNAFLVILKGAWDPAAVTGGMLGSAFHALRVGAARGVFTNEAGMGTAAIAHSAADAPHPVHQGMLGIMEVFIDTIVICTMTALVILCSGVSIPYGSDVGASLTTVAFCSVYGNWVSVLIALFLCLFAVATILGWGLYGLRCAECLLGERAGGRFVWLQGGAVILGAVLGTGTVWILSEIVNGLMMIPNLIALAFLSPKLMGLIKEYRT